jgi:hypothetical protein
MRNRSSWEDKMKFSCIDAKEVEMSEDRKEEGIMKA